MVGLSTIYTMAGVILIEHLVEHIATVKGHGDKVPWVKIGGYIIVMGIALDAFWDGVRYVSSTFHVWW